jgi:hypothetical protein
MKLELAQSALNPAVYDMLVTAMKYCQGEEVTEAADGSQTARSTKEGAVEQATTHSNIKTSTITSTSSSSSSASAPSTSGSAIPMPNPTQKKRSYDVDPAYVNVTVSGRETSDELGGHELVDSRLQPEGPVMDVSNPAPTPSPKVPPRQKKKKMHAGTSIFPKMR